MSNYKTTLQSNNTALISNNLDLQSLIDQANALPDAGVELPELANEGSASDLLSGKQLIDGEGKVVTGSFSIDSELSAQDNLISQIQSAVNGLPDIDDIEPTLQDKTVTPTTSKQTVKADNGYDGLDTVTVNAMSTATQATPSINVNSSGLITASATQAAGYVSAGTKSATKQLTTQAAQTITPSTTDKTIASGRYLTGIQTIKGDANLVAGNIKSGVSIFGVNGSYTGSGGGSGDGDHSMEDGLISSTITHYENNRVTTIGIYAFQYNIFLESVSFPECIEINENAFYLTYITHANFPKCTNIEAQAFSDSYYLASVNIPECVTIKNGAFFSCAELTSIDLPKCTNIWDYAFQYSGLSKITLGAPTVCTLHHIDAFEDSGITPTTGYIYVPASLVDSYKTATNWSHFADRIFAISTSDERDEPEDEISLD